MLHVTLSLAAFKLELFHSTQEFVSATNLNIVAAGVNVGVNRITDGVRLDTSVDNLRVDTSVDNLSIDLPGTGGVVIREADDIVLTSIQQGNESFGSVGDLDVVSGGSIRAEFIDKWLTAADDISIVSLSTVQANVNLVAGDDVTSVGAAEPILADRLTVRASNSNNDGSNDGIVLSTEAFTLENSVFVETAINQVGSISITSGVDPDLLTDNDANLVAGLVFSRGSNSSNAIELTAEGAITAM